MPPTALRAGPPEGERAPSERPGGAHVCPLRRCAPVPPRGSERLRSGRAALMSAPYGAARRSPQGGASASGTAERRSCSSLGTEQRAFVEQRRDVRLVVAGVVVAVVTLDARDLV